MKNSFLEYFPHISSYISLALKLLLLPGFPIIIKGILVTNATNSKNIFSFKDLFFPIPFFKLILFNIKSCSLKRI